MSSEMSGHLTGNLGFYKRRVGTQEKVRIQSKKVNTKYWSLNVFAQATCQRFFTHYQRFILDNCHRFLKPGWTCQVADHLSEKYASERQSHRGQWGKERRERREDRREEMCYPRVHSPMAPTARAGVCRSRKSGWVSHLAVRPQSLGHHPLSPQAHWQGAGLNATSSPLCNIPPASIFFLSTKTV